jgi:acyl homoserine lactone synthase
MIECFNYETAHFFDNALAQQHRLRHKVFVERQKWAIPYYKGMEYDQFDTPAAHYLVWRDEWKEVRGVARLSPTDCPYMLQDIFSDLIASKNFPRTSRVWEGTRFGIDQTMDATTRKRILLELIYACLEFGLYNNIDEYWVLMPVFVLRTFQRMGCSINFLGDPTMIDGSKVVAATAKVTPEILKNVQTKTGLNRRILITAEDLVYQKAA